MALSGFSKPEQLPNPKMLVGFHCGTNVIDNWVQKHAGKAKLRGTAVVYIAQPVFGNIPDDSVAGFYTLSAYSLQRSSVTTGWVTRNTPTNIPAILLGMLAVDERYKNLGLGSALLQDAIIRARFVADNIGAKVLVVDPLSPELAGFYAKYGFREIAETGQMAAKL